MSSICPGCGGRYPDMDGPHHAYMISSSGCWHAYGLILAHEYADKVLFDAVHRLSVDTFALQHPGDPNDRRANQSVFLHYISLYLIFDKNLPHPMATRALKTLSRIPMPQRPIAPGNYDHTVSDIDLTSAQSHMESVMLWARSTFEAWTILRPSADSIIAKSEL